MSVKMSVNRKKAVDAWDVAISDAEKKIQEAQVNIARLKRSIKTFKELRDEGEPFPSMKQRPSEAKNNAAQ